MAEYIMKIKENIYGLDLDCCLLFGEHWLKEKNIAELETTVMLPPPQSVYFLPIIVAITFWTALKCKKFWKTLLWADYQV